MFPGIVDNKEVREDARAGTSVGSPLRATDEDNDPLTYSLDVSGAGSDPPFVIDRRTGQIRVADGVKLDYETQRTYSVRATATDSFNAGATVSFSIVVTDVKEAPEAVDDADTTDEDEPVLIDVRANDSDPDTDTFNLTVSVRSRPHDGTATVDPLSGKITYTAQADYYGADTFVYTVSDGLLTDEAVVSVTVRSLNDAPTFPATTAERSVSEKAQAGDPVGAPVTATDVDGDTLSYSLSGSFNFEIEEHTARLTVRDGAVLDSANQPIHTVIVTAEDGRGGRASIEVTITVTTGPVRPPVVTGGGGGGGGSSGPSPSKVDFAWTVTRDIEGLDSGNDSATGSWSDGETLWVADNPDGAGDGLYAYDLRTGERREDLEFKLDERNRAPRGIWSDGETAWVSDSGQNRLFAHDLTTGERLPERDLELAPRNRDARAIWSDDETMFVLDGGKNALFSYDLATGDFLAEYALHNSNDDPRGIWSDGVTVWVSDHGAKRLFAYRLEDGELKRNSDEEFKELSKASNNSPRGIWSDGDFMYVADESDDKVYSYNMPDAIDARLASLSLSGVEFGEFDPGRTEYKGAVADGVTETTVAAGAMQRRTDVAIHPPDADGNEANGHQVALGRGSEITVTVTSADGSRERTYRVTFEVPFEEIALEPGWTSFEWPGADGLAIAEALRDGDIADRVVVIYVWSEEVRTWLAFFPGLEDVPGINTLTALNRGSTYWIAVGEPVTWSLETTPLHEN